MNSRTLPTGLKAAFLLLGCFLVQDVTAQRIVHIETNVIDAHVFADSTWIGTAGQSPFSIEEGVRTISVIQPEIDVWSATPFVFSVGGQPEMTFKAIFKLTPEPFILPETVVSLDKSTGTRDWITFAAAGTSILSGILAIHFRTKADNRFDDYLETGSSSTKSKVKRLDLQSGVALGVMQVGVGVIAFRLVF